MSAAIIADPAVRTPVPLLPIVVVMRASNFTLLLRSVVIIVGGAPQAKKK
jgi:hypothetical protein